MPSISIILPVYNGMAYLHYAINSVLEQSYTDFEFLILDDCSTDDSWNYICGIKDGRVKIFRNDTNKGLFYNLNFLINNSSTNLIKLWSQDDIMRPNAIEEIVSFHKRNINVGFSYTGVDYIDGKGTESVNKKIDNTPEIIDQITHAEICFYTGSIAGNIANVTLNKAALDKVGLFNESMIISGDFDMWVRIAEFFEIGYVKKPLVLLRNHDGQLSRQTKYYIRHIEEDAQAFRKLFSYISPEVRERGKTILRNNKLMFYTALMLHSLKDFRIKDVLKYWKAISNLDSPMVLIAHFFYKRVINKKTDTKYKVA